MRTLTAAARSSAASEVRQRRVDAEVARLIAADKVETLYANTPESLVGGVAFAALLAWALSEHVGMLAAWGWCAFKSAVILARAGDWWLFRRASDRRHHVAHWQWRHAVGAVIDGLSWSLAWLLFVPTGAPLLDGALLAGLIGVASVGAFTLTAELREAMAYLAALLLPLAGLEAWTQRGSFSLVVVAGTLVYYLVLLNEAKRSQQQKNELLRLRFENAAIAEEREQALRRVEEASQAKTRFLATVSHELRTPLNGIMGMSELLADGAMEPHCRERLDVIQHSAAHLLTLIEDLLDVSRIEFGRFELHAEPTPLRQLVREVTGLLEPIAAARGLRLLTSIDPSAPAVVRLDAPRVRQVLHNLVGNALKFTEHGEVRLGVIQRGEVLQFTVADTGKGIAPALLSRIFDAFERGEDHRQAAGTGLGLTISRQLARAMGGNLTASSTPGEGAVFVFTVEAPMVHAPQAAAAPVVQLPERLGGEVLLVEDNPVNALVARGMLESLGLTVREAHDGEQALAELLRKRPDLVLMDCQMPGLDGWEATRRWRAMEQQRLQPRLPIIALTANAVAGDREVCLSAGMDDHVAKPFSRERLALTLQRYLSVGAPIMDAHASSPRTYS